MAHRSLVSLRHPVKTRCIFRVIFPNPPAIIGPLVADVAMPITENNHARRSFDARIPADVVLVTGRTAKRRRGASSGPMDIDGRDSADKLNFTIHSQAGELWRRRKFGPCAFRVNLFLFRRAVINLRALAHKVEYIGTPARFKSTRR